MTNSVSTRRAFGQRLLGAMALPAATGLLTARQAAAATLAPPTDKPILTISGKIHITNVGETAQFDRAMLEALGMTAFETHTPWYDKVVRFEGPLMRALLASVGAYGDTVEAHALNDYSTAIPIADFTQYGAILALKRDGSYLTVRDKGPLFVVYPYDTDAELRQQKYYGRSAWQVAQFIIK
jgi:hypothetical protein